MLSEQAQQMVGNRKVTIFYGQDVEDKIAGDTSKGLHFYQNCHILSWICNEMLKANNKENGDM